MITDIKGLGDACLVVVWAGTWVVFVLTRTGILDRGFSGGTGRFQVGTGKREARVGIFGYQVGIQGVARDEAKRVPKHKLNTNSQNKT